MTTTAIPDGFRVYRHGSWWCWQSDTVTDHAGTRASRREAVACAWQDKAAETAGTPSRLDVRTDVDRGLG